MYIIVVVVVITIIIRCLVHSTQSHSCHSPEGTTTLVLHCLPLEMPEVLGLRFSVLIALTYESSNPSQTDCGHPVV